MTPKEWFNQFPLSPLAGKENSPWCARHWAPCPEFGANGFGATVELMQVWVDEIAPRSARTAQQRQTAMDQAGKICCLLGDERMYQIWSRWRPTIET